jgi:O-antigen/teichoic acid export membrane protein
VPANLKLLRGLIPADASTAFLIRGVIISITLRVTGVALGYAAHVVISRLLGVHGYGVYVIGLTWALVLTLPARLGFDQSPLKYTTVYLEIGELGALRGFIRVAIASVTLASVAITVALICIGVETRPADLPVIIGAALLILPQALLGVISVIIRGSNRVFATQFYDQLLRPVLLIVLLLIVAHSQRQLGAPDALILHALAAYVALLLLIGHFWKIFANLRKQRAEYRLVLKWFAASLPLLVITVAQELLNQLEIVLLGLFGKAAEAGLFSAAWRLASLLMFALTTFGIICGPLVAAAYHRSDHEGLTRLTHFAARLSTGSAGLIAIVLILCGKSLLRIFGPDFEAAYLPMLVLLVGGLVNAFTGIVAYLLTMTGRERTGMGIFSAALGVSLTMNLLLIPRFGALGAAISSSTAVCVWNLAMAFYVRRKLGIDATALGRPAVTCFRAST